MHVKYPRMLHLPWSPGRTKDDRVLKDTSCFNDKHVVVSLKMDGESTTMYSDHIHARSLDSDRSHPSRHYVNGLWANIRWQIPKYWRVCGENLYAKHSIHYTDLAAYFMVTSIWDSTNKCLPYWMTKDFCDDWGLFHVPPIYNGFWLDNMEAFLVERFKMYDGHEGYVIRSYSGFDLEHFEANVAKYVKEHHVQTDEHWMHKQIILNRLGR